MLRKLPPSRIIDKGPIKVRIDYNLPEEDPARLAVMLAEEYNRMAALQRDEAAFRAQANAERQKGTQLQFVLGQVRERKREDRQRAAQGLPPVKRSRMDPLNTYDVDAITTQIAQHKTDMQMLTQKADTAAQRAGAAKAQIVKLEAAIRNKRAQLAQRPIES